MAQVTQEMASEYQRIFSKAKDDPGTAGDEGEENWATLFREWLPSNYHVTTKGRLIGHDGSMSPQIDLLVLKPSYPRKLMEKKVWLADGVAAAFECKTTLTAAHVTASVQRAELFKSLCQPRAGTPARELRSPLIYGLLAHSHSWKGAGSKPTENITKAFDAASAAINHPRFLIDVICVADLGTWSPMAVTYHRADWVPENAAALRAVFGGDWGVTTSMLCASHETENQAETFSPIGALIGNITQALARNDPLVRDFADYFMRVDLWGTGSGRQRFWPPTVYSDGVRTGIESGRSTNGVPWDEWTFGLI